MMTMAAARAQTIVLSARKKLQKLSAFGKGSDAGCNAGGSSIRRRCGPHVVHPLEQVHLLPDLLAQAGDQASSRGVSEGNSGGWRIGRRARE
jgi:hypothetical protein